LPGVLIMFAVNFGLNFDIYPRLLKYQASNQAGIFVNKNNIPENQFYSLNYIGSHSLNFYAHWDVSAILFDHLKDTLAKRDIWLYVDEPDYLKLSDFKRVSGKNSDIMFDRFSVQNMSLEFLNPESRLKVIHNTFLMHLAKNSSTPTTLNK